MISSFWHVYGKNVWLCFHFFLVLAIRLFTCIRWFTNQFICVSRTYSLHWVIQTRAAQLYTNGLLDNRWFMITVSTILLPALACFFIVQNLQFFTTLSHLPNKEYVYISATQNTVVVSRINWNHALQVFK